MKNRRVLRASEVAPLMHAKFDGRGGWVALAQFAQHWNRYPEFREWMKAEPLPDDTDPERAALVAAMVHSLCVRDGLPVPAWVPHWRCPTAVAVDLAGDEDSPFERSARSRSPSVCDYHRAYFEVSFRDKR